ncbi:hypothetical protein [Muriicola marianensis]|uniref:Cardiolipin synthetase n=1 Tax=Muriicola marianensis TaxID=1324801 RepID=A0ABQ1QS54_9FLAO|nr:hypothetical protein [Muriicola marianensis]GGD43259.1 hypothetical protein GCM10011361_07760 [Muriicola marianensis]
MKRIAGIILLGLLGCSDAELVSSWKNPDIVIFDASKVLVVGMTPNPEARQAFESRMMEKFEEQGVEAMRSIDLFDVNFTVSARTEAELDDVEQSLLDKDFDAILFTKILGSETRQTLAKKLSDIDRQNGRFKDDYLSHQNIYYEDDYYDQYTVYLVESSLYCICVGKERELIWRGVLEIPDPIESESTIEEYIDLVVSAMKEQELIFRDKNP